MFTVWQWARLAPSGGPLVTTHPDETVSAGTWAAVGAATLHAATGDDSDTTYAESSTGTASDTMKLGIPSLGTISSGDFKFRVRARKV